MADEPVPQGPSPQVPFRDLRFTVWCPDCRVHELFRCGYEYTAESLAAQHNKQRPGHTAAVRNLDVEDVNGLL